MGKRERERNERFINNIVEVIKKNELINNGDRIVLRSIRWS